MPLIFFVCGNPCSELCVRMPVGLLRFYLIHGPFHASGYSPVGSRRPWTDPDGSGRSMLNLGSCAYISSWCYSRRSRYPARVTRHADNQFLQLYHEEEDEAPEEEPRPDPGREGSGLEEGL